MEQIKGYRYRLCPTREQQQRIDQTFGCSRFVFNQFLEQRKQTYLSTGKGMTYNQTSAGNARSAAMTISGISMLRRIY